MNQEQINKYKDFARNYLFINKHYISAGLGLAKSLTAFATNNNPLSFIEGGFNLLTNVSQLGNTTREEFFAPERGWKQLVSTSWKQKPMFDIFSSVLENRPYTVINYGSNLSSLMYDDKVYDFSFGSIGQCQHTIYYKSKTKSYDDIWAWFLDKKLEALNSKFYSLNTKMEKTDRWSSSISYDLCAEEPNAISSEKSEYYTKYLNSYLDKGINRSIIFLGAPGTGKTTLIQTILKNTNLTSFKFRYDAYTTDLNSIKYLLQALKVEALILDDFDQGSNGTFLLEFLEWANRNIKLTLASSNSLKTVHPAIVRPGRFAEVIEVNEIDDTLLKILLGDRYDSLKDKVNKWPVAYVNELITRLKIHDDLNEEVVVKELNDRVEKALSILKA